MTNFEEIDYFTDASLAGNPYAYYDYLRSKGPLVRLPQRGVVAVTGYEEGLAIFLDDERFSSINSTYGPNPLPFEPDGDDITDLIEKHRSEIPFADMISSLDRPAHTRLRTLLMGMITPVRLAENEKFMRNLSNQLIDEFIERKSMDFIADYAQPFATLVIADLLGVPEEDHADFRRILDSSPGVGTFDGNAPAAEDNPLIEIGARFVEYVESRRKEPRDDVMTKLAQAKYADGSLSSVLDVVSLAVFLFAAGQDTTVRVMGGMLRYLAEDPSLQERLRAEPQHIPNFIEEVLRLQSAVKSDFRLAKKAAIVGGMEIDPGTPMMMVIGAMNRDPRKFNNPHEVQIDRKNAREHIAFARGIHSCAGAPLARAEMKITLDHLFGRLTNIEIDETRHGPAGARKYSFLKSFILHGLTDLHLTFDPMSN